MQARWLKAAGWIAVGLAALFFLWNGVQKLIGTDGMIAMFRELGYPDWSRVAVGLAETAGGLALLVPRLTTAAAAFLGCLMIGAMFAEWQAGHTFEILIPAQWLIVFALIAWVRTRCAKQAVRGGKRHERSEQA